MGHASGHGIDARGIVHGAVQVVDAVVQGLGRQVQSQHHPIGLEMGDIVQEQPGHRVIAQVLLRRHFRQMAQGVGVVAVAQGDEGVEAAGAVLEIPQAGHMIHPVAWYSTWP